MPYLGVTPAAEFTSNDLNGAELILDADADTTITADTDDQIDIRISGADDFQFTANTFTAQAGSTIAAQAVTATTLTGSGILSIDDATQSTSGTTGSIHTDGGLGIAKDLVVAGDINAADGAEGTPSITFAADTDTGFWRPGSNEIRWSIGSNAMGHISASQVGFGTITNNANQSRGITVDQATLDDECIALKSGDVAHGMTAVAETDTYGVLKKVSSTNGGLLLQGLTEDKVGVQISSIYTNGDTVKGSSGRASTEVHAYLQDGTGVTITGANKNMFMVTANGDVAGFLVDSDGDLHYDGSTAAFDEYDDALMLRTFQHEQTPDGIIKTEFDKWVKYNKKSLEETGIIGTIDPDNPDHYHKDGTLSRPLVCLTQLQRLEVGAIVQQRAMFETMKSVVEVMLPGFSEKLNERLEAQSLPALPA